jgi:hypothetical protein
MSEVRVSIEKDEEDRKYDDWRVDDAYCTLKRAEEIKQDKKMMGLIQERLDKDKKAIRSLDELKKKIGEDYSVEEE